MARDAQGNTALYVLAHVSLPAVFGGLTRSLVHSHRKGAIWIATCRMWTGWEAKGWSKHYLSWFTRGTRGCGDVRSVSRPWVLGS